MGCSKVGEQALYLAWQYSSAERSVGGPDDVIMGELSPQVLSVGKGEVSSPTLLPYHLWQEGKLASGLRV